MAVVELQLSDELLERRAEVAALTALVAAAERGGGRLVAIEGPPGIGKTRLLGELRRLGDDAGLRVLRARGSELEREFSYGVARQLLEPSVITAPPERRAELLAGAADLAAPLFETAPAPATADGADDVSFATLHGLYWLTANLAAEQPLLLAIDDLHWSDAPSLRFLGYLLRRLEGLPVLIAVGLRPAEPGADAVLLAELLHDSQTVQLRPAPLTPEAVSELVRHRLGAECDPGFCTACHESTGGNPLLLRALILATESEGIAPTADNAGRVREIGPAAVSRAVGLRLARLSDDAKALAASVALLGDDVDPRLAAELAGLDDAVAARSAAALVAADMLRPGSPLTYVHPVVRAAVEEQLSVAERREGHLRASALLRRRGAEPERVAAHLLGAPHVDDPWVVDTLRVAASQASRRGSPDIAARYLRRAIVEESPDEDRAGMLAALGSLEFQVDGDGASSHLEQSIALERDPVMRARTAVTLGRTYFFQNQMDLSVEVQERALADVPAGEADLRARLEAGILTVAIYRPTWYRRLSGRLEALYLRNEAETTGERMLQALYACEYARAGGEAEHAAGLARRALQDGDLFAPECGSLFGLALQVLAMADAPDAVEQGDAAVAAAHRNGSLFHFATAAVFHAIAHLFRGDLAAAEELARSGARAARAQGLGGNFPYGLGRLADSLIEQGRLAEAADVLDWEGDEQPVSEDASLQTFVDTRARLLLEQGRPEPALRLYLESGRRLQELGVRNPAFMPWRGGAALCHLALGDRAAATALIDDELVDARAWGAPRALGRALRVRALVADGDAERIAALRESVAVLEPSPARLELAKSCVELGAALRRSNQRADSREPLRTGHELALVCGAAPVAERARTELAATGARPRSAMLSGPDSLTPSERRVAELAAAGRTNRDIAQALFVTAKTVEVHLSSTYRKLGIGGRGELAAALSPA
jgi:DNA-binding CsgD family transcriptional regulator/tetratricopeptide (TPR) repeat protein